jgi:muconolactone delta-isomerase
MKVLALDRIKPTATMDKMRPFFKEEAQQAYQLYMQGALRELYFRSDRPGAAIILECKNVDEARETLATMPLVKAGLLEFDVIPLGPFPFEHAF